jgi:hypothetical protein
MMLYNIVIDTFILSILNFRTIFFLDNLNKTKLTKKSITIFIIIQVYKVEGDEIFIMFFKLYNFIYLV